MTPFTFVFIGRSGCGKGTQADLLMKFLKEKYPEPIEYIETGKLFREFINGDSYTNKLTKEMYDQGKRAPSFLAISLWARELKEKFTGKEHLVFDGTPRSFHETGIFNSMINFYHLHPYIVHINVSRTWSEEKLKARGRIDDKEMSDIKERLDWYEKDVVPAIEYFQEAPNYIFIDVNGEQTIEEVFAELMEKLNI